MAEAQNITDKQLNAFPEKWRGFLRDMIQEKGIKSLIKRRDLYGRSGASLWVVDVQGQPFDGAAILKVASNADAGREIHGHQQVLAMESIRDRIPELPLAYSRNEQYAMLMTVAGKSLSEVEPLARCSSADQQSHLQQIADLFLSSLNPRPTFPTETVPIEEILREWLGPRRCNDNGRLAELLINHFHIDPSKCSFRFGEHDYPNPFFLCMGGATHKVHEIVPAYGRQHGDLHENNILVRGQGHDATQYLIDFASFEENKPIFFDHAYLELSLLLRSREGASQARWVDVLQGLIGLENSEQAVKNAKETDDQGLLRSVGFIRKSVLTWIDSSYPNRREDLRSQLFLARVAAGLNFAAKRLQRNDDNTARELNEFAFLYAASAARELFNYLRLDISHDGPVACMTTSAPKPASTKWREVWDACNGFDHHQAVYILIASEKVSDLPESARRTLGKASWSLVIEFHTSPLESALFETCHKILQVQKSVHRIFPSQEINLDFASAMCWVMAEGNTPVNGVLAAGPWKKEAMRTVRSLGEKLRRTNSLRPTHVLILGDGIDPAKLRATLDGLDEALTTPQVLLVCPPANQQHPLEKFLVGCEYQKVSCYWQDLTSGFDLMFGDQGEKLQSQVPVRDEKSDDIRLQNLPEGVASEIAECLEIVHSGLANRREEEGTSDFLHGNTVTWRELDLNRDVIRGRTQEVIDTVRTIISERREKSYTIEHTPGAGGTTLAKRIAWSLRNDYPSVCLTSYIQGRTAGLVERLFQFTHLPIFIVVEETLLSGTRRDLFFNELKSRTISFMILDVRRRFKPRDTPTSYALIDPMDNADARRFLEIYRQKAPASRHGNLKLLATDHNQLPFRSAFFFGLIAFEGEFRRVPDYVAAHIGTAPEGIKEAIAQLALITRYSQDLLPIEAFVHLLGFSYNGPLPINWSTALGSAAVLLVNAGRKVGIAHPLLADEILHQALPGGKDWLANLADFCVRLITTFAEKTLRESDFTQDILSRIFLSREPFRETLGTPHLFSELINILPSDPARRRVMEALCNHFEENSHFWNHMGRLINFRFKEHERAKECFRRAINLKVDEEEHHHGLGMVFRFEVKDLLKTNLDRSERLEDRLRQVQPLFEYAEKCFQVAREINPMSAYSLYTPIQMAHQTLERLVAMRRSGTYGEFLALNEPASSWAREILERSEGLLERFQNLEAGSSGSERLETCSGWIQEMQGNVAGMITTFANLLASTPEERKPPLRRTLARAYLRRQSLQPDIVKKKNLKRTAELMAKNLEADPRSGSDLLLWLRAARMLPEFTLTEALERFEFWASTGDVVANYYLYILHFLDLRKGAKAKRNSVMANINKCKHKSNPLISKNCFEWIASEKLDRPCPLVHFGELGGWDRETRFIRDFSKLALVEGRIEDASNPQSGAIEIDGVLTFFVPRPSQRSTHQEHFWPSDRNTPVLFYLGFTHEGPRAWSVRKKL